MFSSEYAEIFKNSFFIKHLRWLLLHHDMNFKRSDCFHPFKQIFASLKSTIEVLEKGAQYVQSQQ